jgi:hypothetical protein
MAPRSAWEVAGRWQYQVDLPYTDPTELAMDVLRHAGEVSIVSDTGTLQDTVRKRARKAWELHCDGACAKSKAP